jgi:hypothetical protein
MAASTDTLRDGLMKLLHLLYEKDILGEDIIMKWYNSGDEKLTSAALRKQVICTVSEKSGTKGQESCDFIDSNGCSLDISQQSSL